MVVVELENETVADFVLLDDVEIEPEYPDVADEDAYPPPCWEISAEFCFFLDAEALVDDNEGECDQNNQAGPHSEPCEEVVSFRGVFFLCG